MENSPHVTLFFGRKVIQKHCTVVVKSETFIQLYPTPPHPPPLMLWITLLRYDCLGTTVGGGASNLIYVILSILKPLVESLILLPAKICFMILHGICDTSPLCYAYICHYTTLNPLRYSYTHEINLQNILFITF